MIKKHLKSMIDDLKDSTGKTAAKELKAYQSQLKAITDIDATNKKSKATLKLKQTELEEKLSLKRLGSEEYTAETEELVGQIDAQLA